MMHIPIMAVLALLLIGVTASAETVAYKDGDVSLYGYLAKVKAAKNPPGVLVLPAWKGVDEFSKNSADKLAALGYQAFVADIYGMGGDAVNTEDAVRLSGHYKSHYAQYQQRIRQGLDALIRSGADPNRLAVIGYCFGGTGALEAARASLPVRGVVSFHGGLSKDKNRPNGAINAKVLVLHGADDPSVKPEDITALIQEMRDGNADWQMIWYGDAVHAFTEPAVGNDKFKGAAYNEPAARRSWEHMKLFLQELFG